MKRYQDYDTSDWFAVAFGLMVVLMFVTVIVWIWVPEWWITRLIASEGVVAFFCYNLIKVSEP